MNKRRGATPLINQQKLWEIVLGEQAGQPLAALQFGLLRIDDVGHVLINRLI